MTEADVLAFLQIFTGSDICHYRTVLTGRITDQGKHEARCLMQGKPLDKESAGAHLRGEPSMGVAQVPINTKGVVRWGVIDVDVYRGFDLRAFTKNIHDQKLPLVVCRSKSGGPHIFMFVKEEVPATQMIEKLRDCAAALGHASSEIFPKQAAIDPNSGDKGSPINLPYYGGTKNLRYALDDNGDAIPNIPEFYAYVQEKSLAKDAFEALSFAPRAESLPLPDGPPCLNRLLLQRPSENRNVILANCANYWKKAEPEKWKEKLEATNLTWMNPPLPSGEVEAIKKSYEKKDYKYQCKVQPLVSVCNVLACRKCRHGVGFNETVITPRTMTKLNTSPPIWYLSITTSKGQQIRIEATSEELQNQRIFQRKCMDSANEMPPMIKQKEWEEIIHEQIKNAEVIDIGAANTPQGQFIEHLHDFLHNRSTADSMEDLLRGQAFRDNDHYYFRPKDLWRYLEGQRFIALKQHNMLSILKNEVKGVAAFTKIKGKGVNHLKLPLVLPNPEQLTVSEFPQSY